jgi:hypothetical protein
MGLTKFADVERNSPSASPSKKKRRAAARNDAPAAAAAGAAPTTVDDEAVEDEDEDEENEAVSKVDSTNGGYGRSARGSSVIGSMSLMLRHQRPLSSVTAVAVGVLAATVAAAVALMAVRGAAGR